MPSRGPKVATKNADRAAIEMSQDIASPNPPPAATPLMRATVGTEQFAIARIAGLKISPMLSALDPPASRLLAADRSAPEQKPRPAPVRTTTRTSSSDSTRAKDSEIPLINPSDIEFRLSGRFRVTVATPSCVSYFTMLMTGF